MQGVLERMVKGHDAVLVMLLIPPRAGNPAAVIRMSLAVIFSKEFIQCGVLCSMFWPRKRPTKMEVWRGTARSLQKQLLTKLRSYFTWRGLHVSRKRKPNCRFTNKTRHKLKESLGIRKPYITGNKLSGISSDNRSCIA